jgi:hypothetical protein
VAPRKGQPLAPVWTRSLLRRRLRAELLGAIGILILIAGFVIDGYGRGSGRTLGHDAGPFNCHQEARTLTVVPFTGLSEPNTVAVDPEDNVYPSEQLSRRVVKLATGSSQHGK